MKTGNADKGYPLKCYFQVGMPSKISLLKELSFQLILEYLQLSKSDGVMLSVEPDSLQRGWFVVEASLPRDCQRSRDSSLCSE
jgi:hypothetical protein